MEEEMYYKTKEFEGRELVLEVEELLRKNYAQVEIQPSEDGRIGKREAYQSHLTTEGEPYFIKGKIKIEGSKIVLNYYQKRRSLRIRGRSENEEELEKAISLLEEELS